MNLGQTFLTFGAFVILTAAILNFNRLIAESDVSLAQDRYRLEALSIANSYAEKAAQKYFDESTLNVNLEKNIANFSGPAELGADAGDNGEIDDFDDYHGITLLDTGRSSIAYRVSFEVDYVTLQGDSFVTSLTNQYHKRMTISIADAYADPYLYHYEGDIKVRDTLQVSFIQSYWFYN